MDSKKIGLIEKFISEIKNKYSNLYIEYNYDEQDDLYEIWHNNADLEYKDEEFKKIVASKAKEILFDNDIFNFYFGYDHFKTIKLHDLTNKSIIDNYHLKTKYKTDNFLYCNQNFGKYKLIKNKKISFLNSDKLDLILEMSYLDKDNKNREFIVPKNKDGRTFNWKNKGMNYNIEEMGLVS